MSSIGEKIRDARVQRGMTQAQLSAGLVTASMISQIESDKAKPSYPLLSAIANRLGLPVEHFLDDLADQFSSMSSILEARCHLVLGQTEPAARSLEQATIPELGFAYAEHQLALAQLHRTEHRYREAAHMLENLREYALKGQDWALLFLVCCQCGYLEYATLNADGAILEWEYALEIGEANVSSGLYTRVEFASEAAEICLRLFHIHQERRHQDEAQRYLNKAMAYARDSSSLYTIAQSLLQDGRQCLENAESARAQELFRYALVVAQCARFMARSVEIEAEAAQWAGRVPDNPWSAMAMAATTIQSAQVLDGELETIERLLGQSAHEIALQRIAICQQKVEQYLTAHPSQAKTLRLQQIRLEFAEWLARTVSGATQDARDRVQSLAADIEQDPGFATEMDAAWKLWLRMARTIVQWEMDAGEFEAAVQWTLRIRNHHERVKQPPLNHLADQTESSAKRHSASSVVR